MLEHLSKTSYWNPAGWLLWICLQAKASVIICIKQNAHFIVFMLLRTLMLSWQFCLARLRLVSCQTAAYWWYRAGFSYMDLISHNLFTEHVMTCKLNVWTDSVEKKAWDNVPSISYHGVEYIVLVPQTLFSTCSGWWSGLKSAWLPCKVGYDRLVEGSSGSYCSAMPLIKIFNVYIKY